MEDCTFFFFSCQKTKNKNTCTWGKKQSCKLATKSLMLSYLFPTSMCSKMRERSSTVKLSVDFQSAGAQKEKQQITTFTGKIFVFLEKLYFTSFSCQCLTCAQPTHLPPPLLFYTRIQIIIYLLSHTIYKNTNHNFQLPSPVPFQTKHQQWLLLFHCIFY